MAHIAVHLAQADHNRSVANHLCVAPHHDWAITAAFYAAVHYFEAWLFDQKEEHSETSIPTDAKGDLRMTAHGWREKLIQQRLSRDCFKSFRRLRDASETARYLSLFGVGSAASSKWTGVPAPDYFTPTQARGLLEQDLEGIKRALGAEWRLFLESLDLPSRSPILGSLVRQKLLKMFRERDELLKKSDQDLRGQFSGDELTLLKTALASKNLTLRGSGNA